MKVTLAICCFNAADTIERSIRAAQALRWDDLEILICDDVSTDESVEIVERLASEDSRIRLIRHTVNKGNAGTRNSLIQNATGEILAFQDDDDESHPDRIAHQVARLLETEENTDGPVVCYCSRTRTDGHSSRLRRAMGSLQPVTGADVALHLLCDNPLPGKGRIGTCTMMARVATLCAIPFDEVFRRCEDREWAIRFALAGGTIVGCPQSLLIYHVTTGPDKSIEMQQEARFRIVRKYKHFLQSQRAYLLALLVHRPPALRFRGTGPIESLLTVALRLYARNRHRHLSNRGSRVSG